MTDGGTAIHVFVADDITGGKLTLLPGVLENVLVEVKTVDGTFDVN